MAPWSCCGGWTTGGSPDCGTAGPMAATAARSWTPGASGIAFEVVQRSDGGGSGVGYRPGDPPIVSPFAVVPSRWGGGADLRVASRFRRLSKDYEHLTLRRRSSTWP